MTLGLPDVRAILYLDEDFGPTRLGFASTTATSRDATGITDPTRFGRTNEGEFQYQDGWIRLASKSDPERVKRAGALDTGSKLLHADDTAYQSPFTPLAYEWTVPWIEPDMLDAAIQMALKDIYVYNFVPETPWDDGNMDADDTDSYLGSGSSTFSKVTDQVYGLVGSQSMLHTNAAANDYLYHATGLKVEPGQQWLFDALVMNMQGGPVSWAIYDFTNSTWGALLAPAASVNGYAPVMLRQLVTIPDGCYKINFRAQNASATGITAWDALPGRNTRALQYSLDSWNSANFNVTGLSEAHYGGVISTGVQAYDATVKKFESWVRKRDFHTEHMALNASPNLLIIDRPSGVPTDAELWYATQRQWYDLGALPNESAVTYAPTDELVSASKIRVARLYPDAATDPHWSRVIAQESAFLTAQRNARRQEEPPNRRQYFNTRVGPGGPRSGRSTW